MDLIEILQAGVHTGASDVHLSPGSLPLARVQGEIIELPGFPELDAASCKSLIYSILYEQQRGRFEESLELDCSIQIPHLARFRVNVLMGQQGVEAVLRVIPAAIPSPEFLGLGPTAMSLARLPRGLVLVTGTAGSGKSTTLACMIDSINERSRKHIITIEDPIEFLHPRKRSLIRQREIGAHTHSFQEALRHSLRQDPDVIMVGELRDLESISLALTAAETGHLCFATLHTSDAASTVDRIIDVFPADQQQQVRVQLAHTLKGVISQTLLPRRGGRGRIAAREVMIVNSAIANLIREGKNHMISNIIETGAKSGMYSLDRSLEEMVKRGIVDRDAAEARAHNPQRLAAAGRPAAELMS